MDVKSKSRWRRSDRPERGARDAGVTPVETDPADTSSSCPRAAVRTSSRPPSQTKGGRRRDLRCGWGTGEKAACGRPRGVDGGGARPAAREVSPGRHGHHGRQLRRGRDGHRGSRHERGQWPHGDDAAADPRRGHGYREGHPVDDRPHGLPRAAGPERHGAEAVVLHDAGARAAPGRRARGARRVSHDPDGRRPLPADRGPAAGGAVLPARRRVPQCLPGLPPDRRPRVWPHVSGSDRDPPHRDAQGRSVGEGSRACLDTVRGLQGRLSRPDRHPADARGAAREPGPREDRTRVRAPHLQGVPPAPHVETAFTLSAGSALAQKPFVRNGSCGACALLGNGRHRDLPPIAARTFHERWKDLA